ncbi:MAG: putative motility protein [Azoarcus sp.]|jgi:hypothetical protein|nr:putative motility protein [Azoarcus sp.]
MDITSLAAAASAHRAAQTQNTVGRVVLEKAIDLQAAGVLALVQALPAPPAASVGGAAGGAVDTWA